MTNFDNGRKAEAAAVRYLEKQGFKIVAQNWRTRTCEIDIVAQKDDAVYFVEVKYRELATQGAGLEYVTPAKLRQMHFAAQNWMHENNWPADCQLAAIEVSGGGYEITAFIDDIIL
jgi:uncharacterized protein (TIGR00252 family)